MQSILLRQVLMISKYALLGISLQVLIGTSILLAHDARSQTKSIKDIYVTINLKDVRLADALETIGTKTNFSFVFNGETLDKDKRISVASKNNSLASILMDLSKHASVKFKRVNSNIYVSKRTLLDSGVSEETLDIHMIEKKITGKVTDENGEALPGVNVLAKGTTIGTITDTDGNFVLNIPDEVTILVFSYVGYLGEEVDITGRTTVDLVLNPDISALSEVVVIGYGVQKKVNLTGAVETVTSEAIENRPATDVSNLLTGQVPGLTILQRSGQPGADAGSITIRGLGTLNNTSPLIIVDGVESSFQNIDPNDIDNVSVLKDAAAAAIYGVRAANGVVIITTKRGNQGKTNVSYNNYFGVQEATNLPKFLGSADFAMLFNEALANDGQAPFYSDSDIQSFRNGNDPDNFPNTDQVGELFTESGFQQNHHLSVTGGNENSRFAVMFGYLSREGLMKNTNYDRYSLRVNVDQDLTPKLNLGTNIALTREEITSPSFGVGGIIGHAFREPPTVPNRFSNGNWGGYLGEHNSIAELADGGLSRTFRNKVITSITAGYEIFEGLKIKGVAAITNDLNKSKSFWQVFSLYNTPTDIGRTFRSGLSENRTDQIDINLQALLTYEKSINQHDFNALLGFNERKITQESINAGISDLPSNNALNQLNAGNQDTETNSGGGFEFRLRSLFGRLNYAYNNRYLFEANFRYDGTSRFPSNDRFSVFPSFSAGWRLSEEDFFNVSFINELKVRASWGQLGNEDLGNAFYPYQPTFVFGRNYSLGGSLVSGISENSSLPNTSITWEVSTNTNFGVDAEFLEGKLNFSIDYFTRKTEDILIPDRSASLTLGASAPAGNFGTVENKGFELSIGYQETHDKFSYYVNGNIAFVTNELTSQGTGVNATPNFSSPFGVNRIDQVGSPIQSLFGYEVIGIFSSQSEIDAAPDQATTFGGVSPGDLRYRDVNGDNAITPDDRVVLGSDFPELNYGIQLGGSYGNFDLSMLWQGVGKVTGYLNREASEAFFNAGKVLERHLDRWTPQNTDASYPRLTIANSNRNNVTNSFFAQDASYLKLRNLQVGYTFPQAILDKIKLEKLRLFFSADNLIIITSFEGFDPEAPIGRGDFYPQVRTFTGGINLSF
ncbi:SusC/RagA family TonB-linked outer membrane protein [Fulvivirgaceae bacterium BMA10]|uniref:SusC/RagA family TonB-linked outer membrane protein n=1 Tax=Splendidivirga corallicola TaxID=3051826 RepID=A0ABT8KJ05_9BACT|nr:SusC/RagA family TonB-linked outer membrane protein [Fulvivirgaceae bacterium BMA10]